MQLDLKPNELYQYKGSSPCPTDFDEFWDASLKEMNEIEDKIELIETKQKFKNVDTLDLYFNGIDNARIHAKYLRPKNATKLPVIFFFHGYAGRSFDYTYFLSYVSQGYCVAALDCRGQAGESEDKGGTLGNTLHGHIIRGLDSPSPKDLLYRKIFLDVAQLVKIVEKFPEIDNTRMYAQGGSQGGALTLICCSLCPQIKKALACHPFLCDYKRVWEMDMAERAYSELKEYFNAFDPRHEREDEIFYRLGYIDVQNFVKRIKAKILMLTGLMDNVCPPSTQFAAFNKITSEKKVIFYPDLGHVVYPDYDAITLNWFDDGTDFIL